MSTGRNLTGLGLVLHSSVAAMTQVQFSGKWQTTPASAVTGKPIYTVNIVEKGDAVAGTLVQVFPNGTQGELPILKPEISGRTLSFETDGLGTKFNWRLTAENGSRKGILHGTEGPTAARQRSGEMVIEMAVRKAKQG